MGTIFKLGSGFVYSLVRAIKKNKSWELVYLSEFKVDQLKVPLLCHMRVDYVGRKHWEGALITINQH